jgi:NADH-quinone oxidoreductase subunit C
MIPMLDQLQAAFERLVGASQREQPGAPPSTVGEPTVESSAQAPVPVPGPVQLADGNAKGYHLDVRVTPEQLVSAALLLDQYHFAIDTVTGVDWLATGEMEVVYDFFHLALPLQVVVRTRTPRDNPEVPTISKVFPGANWHERETHEFFGIRFAGHPNLTPLLLPEDATYHPLRKDFTGAN